MKSIFLSLLFLYAASGSGVLKSFKTPYNRQVGQICDDSLTDLEVLVFDVTPWPPVRESEIKIRMKGVIHRDLTVRTIDVKVLYNEYDFYSASFYQVHAYEVGEIAELRLGVYLPSTATSGNYQVQIKVKDDSEQYLNCWEIEFPL